MTTRTPILPRRPARRPSTTEKVVGGGVLLAIAALVALFFVAGSGAGPAGLPEPEPQSEVSGALLPLTSPAGWPRGEIERYDANGLFEKINGKADAYIALDVVGMHFAGYARPDDPSTYVDVYLYDMGAPLSAFGIYRDQRGADEATFEAGEEGAAAGAAAFARAGRFYVEVVGSGPEAASEARALTRAACDGLPKGEGPVSEPAWFPDEGRERVRYVLRDALGMESLRNAFVATYAEGCRIVVARLDGEAAARAAAKDAEANLEFLGTPATFSVAGKSVVGVVGKVGPQRRKALLDSVLQRLGGVR